MTSRLRVFFLTHRLPYAPNRGDRIRSYHIIRNLAPVTDLTVVSLVHDASEAAQVGRLTGIARTIVAPVPRLANYLRAGAVLATSKSLTGQLLSSPALQPALEKLTASDPPDVILAFCSSMAYAALSPPLAGYPLVIDMVDADSAKWKSLSERSAWPLSWIYRREAVVLRTFEAQAMRRAHATFAVNEREVSLLKQIAPDARIETLENGVDLDTFAPPPSSTPASGHRVIFCGVMNYRPNEEGAVWLAQKVWPLVRAAIPTAELRIVGATPSSTVRALHDPASAVTVTGYVPDVRAELWSASVATAPLHISRGVQTKVIEAVAAGLPCVITSAVSEGLPHHLAPACTIADAPDAFAASIVEWLRRPPHERRRVSRDDLADLKWESRLRPLLPALEEAARAPRKGPA